MYRECDEAFLEQIKYDWEFSYRINDFHRVLAIANRCKSILRVEEENEWLRHKIDMLTATDIDLQNKEREVGTEEKDKKVKFSNGEMDKCDYRIRLWLLYGMAYEQDECDLAFDILNRIWALG